MCGRKSVLYYIHNFNKFKYIFVIFVQIMQILHFTIKTYKVHPKNLHITKYLRIADAIMMAVLSIAPC